MNYTIGTRGSRLSIAQTTQVIYQLMKAEPDSCHKIVTITTKGDADSRPLFAINQKGIFEKEIDKAVIQKEVDFAVHSMKDVPSELPEDLILACVPKREQVNDVLISKEGVTLNDLRHNAIIGTSSLRRAVQISRIRPDITVKPIRGNIETRIKKITSSDYDAIVLAYAGMQRLKVDARYVVLSVDNFVPSPGQGALAIIARKDDTNTISMLKKIEDVDSRQEINAERAVSSTVDSGCRFPVGALARSKGDTLTLNVSAFSIDGAKCISVKRSGVKSEPVVLGNAISRELYQKGIKDLALNWREGMKKWNKI